MLVILLLDIFYKYFYENLLRISDCWKYLVLKISGFYCILFFSDHYSSGLELYARPIYPLIKSLALFLCLF